MYVTLKKGDRLPTVALAQARLVERKLQGLRVDGYFGAETERAVGEFQRSVRIPQTMQVDPATWSALCFGHPLSVIDAIDATDITVLQDDGPHLNDGHADVVVSYGTSRGTQQLISDLVGKYGRGSVALLRLHGHGSPGHMVVTAGTTGYGSSMFAGVHFSNPRAVAYYQRLGSIMKPYGSIELHGCRVAQRETGYQLLVGLANATGVPVSAGLRYQTGGADAARFEGPVRTCFPNGGDLKSWARQVFSMCQW